jgi:hypothetical protein
MCAEPANCYIVAPNNSITIPVNIKGNGGNVAGTGLSTTFTPSSVGIVWQTTSTPLPITIGALNTTNNTVTITAGSNSGNAVIAAYDASATPVILWSWHIWVTDYNPNTPSNGTTYSYTNTSGVTNVFMDRNLGATSVATFDVNTLGLLYQWGRKDPFVNADTYNGTTSQSVTGTEITMTDGTSTRTIDFVIANPTIYVARMSNDDNWLYPADAALWGGASYGATKTIFDPCPAGWRVPSWNKTSSSASPWIGLGTYNASTYWSTNGFQWTTTPGIGFWPATGYRNLSSGNLAGAGTLGYYLSAKISCGFMAISSGTVNLASSRSSLPRGSSVRCVQEW